MRSFNEMPLMKAPEIFKTKISQSLRAKTKQIKKEIERRYVKRISNYIWLLVAEPFEWPNSVKDRLD